MTSEQVDVLFSLLSTLQTNIQQIEFILLCLVSFLVALFVCRVLYRIFLILM